MTRKEYDKLIRLMHNGALQNVDTGRLDGKEEDVIPLEDAITIIRKIYAESEEEKKNEINNFMASQSLSQHL